MAGDDTEEATYDPSQQRLRKLREQGQIPRSQDATGAFVLIVVLLYVIFSAQGIIDTFTIAMRDIPIFEPTAFTERAVRAMGMMLSLAAQVLLPIIAVAIVAALFAAFFDIGGLMFNFTAMVPNVQRFNPVEGVKNMFRLQSLINLLKSFFKLTLLMISLGIIIALFLNDVLWAPTCGLDCIFAVGETILFYIIVISIALMIVFAAIDVVVSRWMFTRDNKMTLTEVKREMKEAFGDPHIRGQRERDRRRMAELAGLVGPNSANLWIAGPEGLIGIAYKPEKLGVPIYAAKGFGENAQAMRARAAENNAAVIEDPELFAILYEQGKVAEPVPQPSYRLMARALVKAGFSS